MALSAISADTNDQLTFTVRFSNSSGTPELLASGYQASFKPTYGTFPWWAARLGPKNQIVPARGSADVQFGTIPGSSAMSNHGGHMPQWALDAAQIGPRYYHCPGAEPVQSFVTEPVRSP